MTQVPTLEGYGCRLRPVTVEDAGFIVNLRNQPYAAGTIHATSQSVEAQESWIKAWMLREHDYYWIIESLEDSGKPIGAIGLYDFTIDQTEAMPGRWVMLPRVPMVVFAPVFLMYKFAFEELKLKRLVLDVIDTNKKVIKFHALYGARMISCPKRYESETAPAGRSFVWFEIERDQWPKIFREWDEVLQT